jgi:diguanylate cyclase (GGDEF)-like protein/PAS domain S-box-containing protein
MLRWLPLIVIAAACGLLATTLAGLETPLSPKTPVLLIIGGIVAGLVLWFRDVSEEHRRREQFEKNYRLLMEHAISAVATHEMVLDTAGRPVDYVFLSANPAFEKHTGLRTADILGRRVTEVLPGIEETHLIETYGKVVLTDTPTSFEEFSEQLGRHYLVHAFPMGDRRFAAVFIDISEAKQAQQEIVHQNVLITSLIDSIPDLIFFKNLEGVYLGCNPQFSKFIGRSRDEIIGKADEELFEEDVARSFVENDRHVLACRRARQNEEWITYPDGQRVLIDTLKTPYWGPDGTMMGIIGISRDITRRKYAERALEERVLALTQPLDDATGVTFETLFNPDDIQQLQDDFARATGVASIIMRPNGTPITAPSHLRRLCRDFVGQTSHGRASCWRINLRQGLPDDHGPVIQECPVTGLWEASAAISVGGHHIANWLVGQVRDPEQTEEQMRARARQLGLDETGVLAAFREIPVMSHERFRQVAQTLFTLTRHLSRSAYQNVQQARFISEQKKSQEKIVQLAHYDQLTGLANRTLLKERFDQAKEHARQVHNRLALCLLDLDGFKNINDLYGHLQGDQLLREVAGRLKSFVRADDTVCRVGGDEFLILFTDLQDTCTTPLVQKIMTCFESPFDIAGQAHVVTASMGVAIFPEDGHDLVTLFKHADAAMYCAKESGRNTLQFFHREISRRVQNRLVIEKELRQALLEDQLELHYQPIWQLTDNRMVGLEALLRWQHPQRGLIPPDQFIPVAEESNLIVSLGQWVLKTACQHMADRKRRGLPLLPVAVNVSARQLFQPDFADFVRQTLTDCGLPAQLLEMEVTESIFLDRRAAIETVMTALKDIGVSLALDDFGTGYSSLSYLKRFRIDKLKIDRSFVEPLCEGEQDAILVATIIRMAQGLGMQVVAEGVETAGQKQFLIEQGCDLAQGYYFCRPQPLEVLEKEHLCGMA